MKLIFESWNKFLTEEEESSDTIEQVRKMVAANTHLSGKAGEISAETVKEVGPFLFVLFENSLDSDHMSKHFDEKNPISTWTISKDQVKDLMLDIMANEEFKAVEERGTQKYKWLNTPTNKTIGLDSLKKAEPNDPSIKVIDDFERFTMTDRVKDWSAVSKVAADNEYELVNQERSPYTRQDLASGKPSFIKQKIGVVLGDKKQNPTPLVNVVVAEIGKIGKKPVVSLMTTYPGNSPVDSSGKDIMDKKAYKDHGYYFLKSGK
tara:strand:- start:312 stop:1100 length:789 start_codon:yes stop_codon:yes gene_type:complete